MAQEHKGSRETYDFIADWVDPNFFYSKKDVWHRFGFLGVFSDYVLSAMQGDILEIGAGESSIYLSSVAKKYGRRFYTCDAAPDKLLNPLTIPGYINARDKITYLGVNDPVPDDLEQCVCYAGPSDDLFERVPITPLAFAFIDGDHLYAQAKKDFYNILPKVVDNGFILLHDTYPANKEECAEHRSGEVWRLRKEIQANENLDCLTLVKGAAMNAGLTIVRKRPSMSEPFQDG